MYIGHVGAALAAKRVRGSIGLLVLLVASYAPDWVDMGMCVGGAYNPVGILSHSIPAVLILMLVGFTGYAAATRDWAGALVIAVLILSHMLLDWITGYKPTWPGGPMIGLELYNYPVADFIAEGIVIVAGVALRANASSAAPVGGCFDHARSASHSAIDDRCRSSTCEVPSEVLTP